MPNMPSPEDQLALPTTEITPLSHTLPDGRQLGVNSNMPGLISLYEGGKAALRIECWDIDREEPLSRVFRLEQQPFL